MIVTDHAANTYFVLKWNYNQNPVSMTPY